MPTSRICAIAWRRACRSPRLASVISFSTIGRKSLNEIKEVLAQMGLHLGMEVPGWPPENIEELAKRFEDHY